MSETVLRLERLENGFEVEIFDEKTSKANEKKGARYESPWKGYAFTTGKEVIEFITKHINSLPKSSDEEFADAAAEAFNEE